MGQCYDVELSLKIKDKVKLISEVNSYINKNQGIYIRFNLENKNRDNLDDIIEIFLTNNMYKNDEGNYTSGFDASYGWESVLDDFFKVMKEFLDDGSYMIVDTDSGHWKDLIMYGELIEK